MNGTTVELAIKVDVDSDRGTRIGVPNLLRLFEAAGVQATFLFSLGPDNTGRAIKRIFRPGFFSKVQRTNVVGIYGLRTLMNGVLLPGPHIGRRNEAVLREARDAGHEVGIHCYDHVRWQDGLARMERDDVYAEFDRARAEFTRIFAVPARTAGAAGWQANALSLAAYDDAGLDYASDARGAYPFFPRVGNKTFRTLQIPTTLPTLDELLGRSEYPENVLTSSYLSWLRPGYLNVMTIHAEIEGMMKLAWFRGFLDKALQVARLVCLREVAQSLSQQTVPVCELRQGSVDGRSGTLAVQGDAISA